MFSAHLVFGDLDGHSSLEFKERASALNVFWEVCESAMPGRLEDYGGSFYDIDNDSLMAGFSDFPGLYGGAEVLEWTLALCRTLASRGLRASFGVDLLALSRPESWPTQLGFARDARRLFIRDDLYNGTGVISRSRLVGDALIVTSRLLSLAKAAKCEIVFSAFQGGNIYEGLDSLEFRLPSIHLIDLTHSFDLIGEKADDLRRRKVMAYGIQDAT
jgi:hypothetical protein